jgi:hypothetical protein
MRHLGRGEILELHLGRLQGISTRYGSNNLAVGIAGNHAHRFPLKIVHAFYGAPGGYHDQHDPVRHGQHSAGDRQIDMISAGNCQIGFAVGELLRGFRCRAFVYNLEPDGCVRGSHSCSYCRECTGYVAVKRSRCNRQGGWLRKIPKGKKPGTGRHNDQADNKHDAKPPGQSPRQQRDEDRDRTRCDRNLLIMFALQFHLSQPSISSWAGLSHPLPSAGKSAALRSFADRQDR